MKDVLGDSVIFVAPKGYINLNIKDELNIKQFGFFKGHLWEQVSLPLYNFFQSSILFCFCGAPPILYKKVIYTIHDLAFVRYPEFFNFFYQFFYRILVKMAYKRFLGISAVSNFTKSELIDVYGMREIFVVSNSINHLTGVKANPKLPVFLKDSNYYLTVGSIDPRKNIHGLVKAFLEEKVDTKLVIIGKGNSVFTEQKYLDKLKSPKIIFTGYLSDEELAVCYENAQCFIYPSLYEGFGIPPLEAIYYKTPILLSDIPVHREIYGNYAHYFPLSGVKDIKHNIKMLISKNKSIRGKGEGHPLLIKYSFKNQKKQLEKIIIGLNL
jgi:glycosyltransferase involved in cell wall biosynthesis